MLGLVDLAGDAADGREARHAQRPEALHPAQVDVRGTQRLDQGGDGVPEVQRPRARQGARREEPGVLGAQPQAHEYADGGIDGGNPSEEAPSGRRGRSERGGGRAREAGRGPRK